MKTVSMIHVFKYPIMDKDGKPVLDQETGKPVSKYRFLFNDGGIAACAFQDDMTPETLMTLAAMPRSETRMSKSGTPYQVSLKSYIIDFRPLVSNDPKKHRAFINSIEEYRTPKVDFGF